MTNSPPPPKKKRNRSMMTFNLDLTERRRLFEWGSKSPKRATNYASRHPSENCRPTYMLHSKLLCVPNAKGSGEVPYNIAETVNPVGSRVAKVQIIKTHASFSGSRLDDECNPQLG